MNLNKIIKKPQLEYILPSIIDNSVPQQVEYTPTVQNLNSQANTTTVNIQNEIDEWNNLSNQISFNSTDSFNYNNQLVSPQTLKDSLNNITTEWPTQSQAWTDYHYSNNSTYDKLIYPVIQSTIQILNQSIENIWTASSSGINLTEILSLENSKLESTQNLKNKILNDKEEIKKKIDECLVHTLSNVLINGKLKGFKDNSSLIQMLKQLQNIYRLTKLQNKIKWNSISKSITNLILKTILENVLKQILVEFSNIESQIISPTVNNLEQLNNLSNNYLCNSFNDLINKSLKSVYDIRNHYIDLYIDYSLKIENLFKSKSDFTDFAKQKAILDRYDILIDQTIQALERLSASGGASDIEKYLTSKLFK